LRITLFIAITAALFVLSACGETNHYRIAGPDSTLVDTVTVTDTVTVIDTVRVPIDDDCFLLIICERRWHPGNMKKWEQRCWRERICIERPKFEVDDVRLRHGGRIKFDDGGN